MPLIQSTKNKFKPDRNVTVKINSTNNGKEKYFQCNWKLFSQTFWLWMLIFHLNISNVSAKSNALRSIKKDETLSVSNTRVLEHADNTYDMHVYDSTVDTYSHIQVHTGYCAPFSVREDIPNEAACRAYVISIGGTYGATQTDFSLSGGCYLGGLVIDISNKWYFNKRTTKGATCFD